MSITEPQGVITPIIHLNGDRRETLLGQLETAHSAVRAAMDALRQCAPNGRNYYPEPGRMALAAAQHRTRQEHLRTVYLSLKAEAIALIGEA